MLWYFKNKQLYDYSTNQIVKNQLAERFHYAIYEDSNEMELYWALEYMKNNNIFALTVIIPLEDLSVNYGGQNDINKDFCDNNKIHYRYEERKGGCMVLFPGNIIIYDVYPTDNFLRQHSYVNDFVDWLKEKEINASTDNNDIMINNTKVIGAVSAMLPEPYKGQVYFGASISINSDPELINQICTKPMKKIPGALSDYGITTEEVMQWTLDWFDKHQYTE